MSDISPPAEIPDPPRNISQTSENLTQFGHSRGKGKAQGRNDRETTSASSAAGNREPPKSSRNQRRRREHQRNSVGRSESTEMVRNKQEPEGVHTENRTYSKPHHYSLGDGRKHKVRDAHKDGEDDLQNNEVTPAGEQPIQNRRRSRRGQFGDQLSQQQNKEAPSSSRRPASPPPNSDLTTRLTFALRAGPPHPDCPICFNPLYPGQSIWSCSLSTEAVSCCWTSFHLKCVREWAKKSTRETKEAFVTRGEERDGEWRCPGCQTKRTRVPQTYLCFCGAVTDPKPGISTPHSCGMPCTRSRASCEHPCPISCHPGPCPPCVLTITPSCHCAKVTLSIRCNNLHTLPPPTLSCGQKCARALSCGVHVCERECHPGDCGTCEKEEMIKCYCGKQSKLVECGEGLTHKIKCFTLESHGKKMVTWEGRYDCGTKCGQSFTCGFHTCSKTCHPPSVPSRCPFDPSIVTHCPCGKRTLDSLSEEQRSKCTDPIQTCSLPCGKSLQSCSHFCSVPCHVGACPPCNVPVTVPCRCGTTTRSFSCDEIRQRMAQNSEALLCDKVCGALRICGRHQCSRICCPLTLIKTGKGKKRTVALQQAIVDPELDDAERLWHECDLVCGKMLSCGSHKCQEADHRGPCPPCLRSSFDELTCHCGRTIILPPIPCGTGIHCTHPCNRPPPSCGHGKIAHVCHEDPDLCPPCPFLTTKPCACGKLHINNVRCSQQKVSCGQACAKLLDCGFHRCQKLCHDDDCGVCSSICGKPRKLCLPSDHRCTLPCHAPSACDESESCGTTITVSCPCGRFQQPMKCGRSSSNPGKVIQQLHCRDECNIAKRNARLAEALGISHEVKEKANVVVYPEELLAFAKANFKFVSLVERTLNDFISSDKKMQVLPYMPEVRRKVVRDLCQIYRIDTQLVDQEPRRSVQLFRRIDSRTPSSLLSASLTSQNSPNLGKLADLRAPQPRAAASAAATKLPIGSSPRGWTSVVASTPQESNMASLPVVSSNMRGLIPPARKPPQLSASYEPGPSNVRENWEED